MLQKLRSLIGPLFRRDSLRQDAVAGLVLGVESVPDGLAAGLLAGVNPVFGLNAYMVGTVTGALFTSATFMAVQATGAMAIVVADVPAVHANPDPERALFTLSVLTGLVMLAAGLLKLGSMLKWVSNAVFVGFINAVGVNIVLGQLDNFSGFEATGANRIARALNLAFHIFQAHWPSMIVGATTIVLIVVLERTRLGPMGMVVAIAATSAAVVLFGWGGVAQVRDITEVPRALPLPRLPDLRLITSLAIPAFSLAFVGLVQGAGISANFPNPDGRYPDASQDFVGQGAANIAAGIFQGMPVAGSMSASSLVKTAGARSKGALIVGGAVMAILILVLGDLVGLVAMPALAGLLMLIGFRTVKPADIVAVWKTGVSQATVMSVTFVLTMLIPLQHAVLVGVGISIILFVLDQSNRITLRRWVVGDDGRLRETNPPAEVGAHEVIVLQPYGSLFFASAPVFEAALPKVTPATNGSVVVLRLRGKEDLGSTFMEVLDRYLTSLERADSKLVLIYSDPKVREQLRVTGVLDRLTDENVYESDEWLGATVARAYEDAQEWIRNRSSGNDA